MSQHAKKGVLADLETRDLIQWPLDLNIGMLLMCIG